MDKHCEIFLILMITTVIPASYSFGYDSATSCSPKMSRRGRAELLATIPCDLTQQAYCNLPGTSYPWHAVRRFVHENQGLMKRMYGDVRHISILRDEIQNNEIDVEDIENTAARYSRDGFRKKKYLQTDEQNIRTNEVLSEPHFRPTTTSTAPKSSTVESTTASTTKSSTTSKPTTTMTTQPARTTKNSKTPVQTTSTPILTPSSTTAKIVNDNEDVNLESPDNNLESNNIIDISTENPNFNNIKVVQPPNLNIKSEYKLKKNITSQTITSKPSDRTSNKTESATISTTLKVVQQIIKAEIEAEIESERSPAPQLEQQTAVVEDAFLADEQIDRIDEDVSIEDDNGVVSNATVEEIKVDTLEKPEDLPEGDGKSNERIFDTKKPNRPNTVESQLFQDTFEKETPPPPGVRGVNACPVKEEVVAPFWANNTRGEVLALLNLYPFEQYVHWEKCTHEHKQMYCREGCRCEQQYRLHRLLAYDPHNECRGIFSDWFRFPSCCICKCYDIPLEFRVTSRSPRTSSLNNDDGIRSETDRNAPLNHIDIAEIEVQRAIYEHATEDWYRPRDDLRYDFVED